MSFFDSISAKLGYEGVPKDIAEKSFYDLKTELPGSKGSYDFSQLKDKVVLIVNTASKCGFTPQYDGLEDLYKNFGEKGLVVLGFPSNEFMSQEPGTDEEIDSFCRVNHGVTFPLMKKSKVNGRQMNEVFAWLKSQKGASGATGMTFIKWNFTKFLVDRQGKVVARYAPTTKPESIKPDIEKLL
ncbi:hypothetical protein L204_101293 [Cryptococcus depauperatus]|nr:glutathione peroxidase [Cryptococcus depauperatus CBS 7855]